MCTSGTLRGNTCFVEASDPESKKKKKKTEKTKTIEVGLHNIPKVPSIVRVIKKYEMKEVPSLVHKKSKKKKKIVMSRKPKSANSSSGAKTSQVFFFYFAHNFSLSDISRCQHVKTNFGRNIPLLMLCPSLNILCLCL